jgi:hypothetical protein
MYLPHLMIGFLSSFYPRLIVGAVAGHRHVFMAAVVNPISQIVGLHKDSRS